MAGLGQLADGSVHGRIDPALLGGDAAAGSQHALGKGLVGKLLHGNEDALCHGAQLLGKRRGNRGGFRLFSALGGVRLHHLRGHGEHPGEAESGGEDGGRQHDVHQDLGGGVDVQQHAGDGGDSVSGSLHSQQHGDHTGHAVDGTAEQEGLQAVAQDDAEEGGLADAQQGGGGGAGADGANLFLLRFQGDGQAHAGGGEAAHAQNGVEGVEPGAGQQADFQHVEDMVYAGQGDDGPEEAHHQAAQTQGQRQGALHDDQQDVLQGVQQGPDDQQGEHQHNEQNQEGGNHEVEDGGHGLPQLLLQPAAQDAGHEGGQDAALIAHDGNKPEEHQGRHAAAGVGHRVGVGQGAVHQHEAQNQPQHRGPAEDPEGGPAETRLTCPVPKMI